MSSSQGHALSAIAFQLAATLEAYEENMAALVRTPRGLELYQRVSAQVDDLRMYAGAWPAFSVAWIEVLIRHFEVTHGLFRLQNGDPTVPQVDEQHRQLKAAIERLRQLCTRAIRQP